MHTSHGNSRPPQPTAASVSAPEAVLERIQRPSRTRHRVTNSPPAAAPGITLDKLPQRLQQLVDSDLPEHEVLHHFVAIASQLTNAIWTGHFEQEDRPPVRCTASHSPLAEHNLALAQSSILPSVEAVWESAKAGISVVDSLTVITAPIFASARAATHDQPVAVLCLALNLGDASPEPFLMVAQTVASSVSQWRAVQQARSLEWKIASTAAIAELMSKVVSVKGIKPAALTAAQELAGFLNSPLVAIASCKRMSGNRMSGNRTQLQAAYGTTEIDRGGKQSRLLQSALDETLLRDSVTTLPSVAGDDRVMKKAHQSLVDAHPACSIVSAPLKTSGGETIGAWICVIPFDGSNQASHEKLARFASITSQFLADALYANRQASLGPTARLRRDLGGALRGRAGRAGLVSASVVALLMMIPIPHRVSCKCLLEPNSRRFEVAQYDGVLLESFVKPGDLVTKGQLLARLDDREQRLQLAELQSKVETTLKKRDVSRSGRDAAATKIAELEADQLKAQIAVLQHRQKHFEIRSKVDGIVLQGDLEDARGAPVRTGDVLVEIAALDELRLEVAVPESDVTFVAAEQPATIVLDGAPFQSLAGTIKSIRPEAEVREGTNVFVAEIELANHDGLLRPGMQGTAKIKAGTRALGWVLFHRPLERVYGLFQ